MKKTSNRARSSQPNPLHVLFVDDDPLILTGLERKFRRFQDEWRMQFVTSGPDALRLLATRPFDVIITDLRMPGMDGVELLRRVADSHPHTLRYILSGQSSRESTYRQQGPAHQFLTKPCDAAQFRDVLHRGVRLQKQRTKPELQRLVTLIGQLPSLPDVVPDVIASIASSQATIEDIGLAIERDPTLTRRLLQVVNTICLQLPHPVSTPAEIATVLGVDALQALVLGVAVFDPLRFPSTGGFCLDQMLQHGWEVGFLAKQLSRAVGADDGLAEDALLAGMVHDLGKLVLVQGEPAAYAEVLRIAHQNELPLAQAEQTVLGVTHAEAGGYVLNHWNFTQPLVEAVSWHHTPAASQGTSFSPLAAVHIANSVIHDRSPKWLQPVAVSRLDDSFVASLECHQAVQRWIRTELSQEDPGLVAPADHFSGQASPSFLPDAD